MGNSCKENIILFRGVGLVRKSFQKLSAVLLAGLFMFALAGTSFAASADDDCGCGLVTGAEKHQIIAKWLSGDAFKTMKKELKALGYQWQGVSKAEVSRRDGLDLIAVPILDPDGKTVYLLSLQGEFQIVDPTQGG